MKVLLIDNTKQDLCEFTRLLERKLQYFTRDIIVCNSVESVIDLLNVEEIDAVILSGSSLNLSQPNKIEYMRKSIGTLLRLHETPVLGICFGMQLIATMYGGTISRLSQPIQTEATIIVEPGSLLLNGESKHINVTLSHQDYIQTVPKDFKVYSCRQNCIQIIESLKFLRFGVQFHPEKQVQGEDTCVLYNFFNYIKERNSLPLEIRDECRIPILFSIRSMKLGEIEKKWKIDRNQVMHLWRHHIMIWDLPAILL